MTTQIDTTTHDTDTPPGLDTGKPRRRRLVSWTAAAVLAAGLAGGTLAVADPFAAPTLDSVGRVDGSAALIAVVAQDDQVVAYVCDGPAGLGERFAGPADGDHAELRSPRGATLRVDLRDGASQGTFTAAGGVPQHFATVPATGTAGWYAAQGPTGGGYTAGWVELGDGTQTGTLRRTGGSDGTSESAPRAAREQQGSADRNGEERAGREGSSSRAAARGQGDHRAAGRGGGRGEDAPRLHHRPAHRPANGNPGVVRPGPRPGEGGGLVQGPGADGIAGQRDPGRGQPGSLPGNGNPGVVPPQQPSPDGSLLAEPEQRGPGVVKEPAPGGAGPAEDPCPRCHAGDFQHPELAPLSTLDSGDTTEIAGIGVVTAERVDTQDIARLPR
ncbi:hypothetical protein EV188_10927 [Actinomycetospora succinea]|uniref:Uncharacterized protein n=1 Tax=Actinomycetospora succinea TaxID=663603 RepID=A0A4R6UXS0_9PSEU|nr:hypothetical protein [Actinomycetospora succinea]TDQ50819.1 hypothetical protein EV188_10927 [Actinomycetospora succinea]